MSSSVKRLHRRRSLPAKEMIEHPRKAGPHHTRTRDLEKGRSRKPKHKEPHGSDK